MASRLRTRSAGYAFILPWLVALVVFIGYPFLGGLYFSLCDYPPLRHPTFLGLENYKELLGDALFQQSLGVTLVYAAVAIPLGVALALTLAMFLNARIRGQSLYRVIFYIPHLVPTVVVALLWLWMFNPEFGLLNVILRGILGAVDAWTGLFFDLEAALAHQHLVRSTATVAAAPLVLAALALAAGVLAVKGRTPRLRRLLTIFVEVAAVLLVIALANAALCWFDAADFKKIHAPGWLSDGDPMPAALPFAPSWALWALIVMAMWGVGQMAVIYLAKLQDVPTELYEAAEIDGAGWWHKTWQITIPMISPVILFNVVMAIIGTFQIFAEPYIMTQGGPEGKTRFLAMFIYDQAFLYQRVGYAAAVAVVLLVVIVTLTVLAFRIFQKRVYYAGR